MKIHFHVIKYFSDSVLKEFIQYFIKKIYQVLIYPSVEHLSCFHFSTIIDDTALNILIANLLCVCISSLDDIPRSGILVKTCELRAPDITRVRPLFLMCTCIGQNCSSVHPGSRLIVTFSFSFVSFSICWDIFTRWPFPGAP